MAFTSAGEILDVIEQYFSSGGSDGLPIVPPTDQLVEAMVSETELPGDTVLGLFPPSNTPVTVRQMAVCAVMAGCRPDYAPVLLAAVRALLDEAFDLVGVATSTKGAAPLLIVNGPMRNQIGLHSGVSVFGPGFRANSTIGRAVRLMIINLGGARPNGLDRGTLGHPGRFSYCIAEDEEGSPWEPLHVERGMPADTSAVTVFGGEGIRQVNMHYHTSEAVLNAVADTLASTGIMGFHNITGRSPHVLVLAKEHRDLLAGDGWTKPLIREYLAEKASISADRMRQVGSDTAVPVPMLERPEDLLVVAAGGDAGGWAGLVTGWSWQSQPVTVEIPHHAPVGA